MPPLSNFPWKWNKPRPQHVSIVLQLIVPAGQLLWCQLLTLMHHWKPVTFPTILCSFGCTELVAPHRITNKFLIKHFPKPAATSTFSPPSPPSKIKDPTAASIIGRQYNQMQHVKPKVYLLVRSVGVTMIWLIRCTESRAGYNNSKGSTRKCMWPVLLKAASWPSLLPSGHQLLLWLTVLFALTLGWNSRQEHQSCCPQT